MTEGGTPPPMKKTIAILAALAIVAAPSTAIAGKKKKGPKPFVSETVSVAMGHPVLNGQSGSLVSITGQEFLNTCAIPASNGLDGYVFELPAEYQTIQSSVEVMGVTPAGDQYDVDLYAFDADCVQKQALNTAGTDESGSLLEGAKYVFIHNYLPGPLDVSFELKPY